MLLPLAAVYILLGFFCTSLVRAKWVEGQIKTSENWAFLARFCFLSMEGQFEYLVEFERDMGMPNLLLYYDDESQWPSVYHSNKTCLEREAVLNKAGQNQIIQLSHYYPETEVSGCVMRASNHELPATKRTSTTVKPSSTVKNLQETIENTIVTSNKPPTNTEDSNYYKKFLETTKINAEFTTVNTYSTTDGVQDFTTENVVQNETDYMWETLEDGNINRNDSDLKSNLKDVEVLFEKEDGFQNKPKRKRSLDYYDAKRKFSASITSRTAALEHTSALERGREKVRLLVTCRNERRFRSARERWWFIAISNCNGNKGLNVKYKFLMTNGPPGDYWHEHFSADEFYVLPILMAFGLAYVLMLMAVAMCSVELKSRQLLHTTYKLFVLSVLLQHAGILLQGLSYAKYAVNGVGSPGVNTLGQFLLGMSEMSYLLLLVLMAKGYTITRARLKLAFTIRLTIFMCTYLVTYLCLFIYQSLVFDPGQVLYLYESPAGYGIIILRIAAWFMFLYSVVFTMKKYPEKGMFYCPFTVCGTLWFYAGPLFILLANSSIDKWVRESIVTAALLFIAFCGHVTFLLLTLPVFANKNFPYHVRTTQVGVMQVAGVPENFRHNVYEPAVIIPLTRRTEELIGNMYQYMASAPPLSLEDQSQTTVTTNQQNGKNKQQNGINNQKLVTNNPILGPNNQMLGTNNSTHETNNQILGTNNKKPNGILAFKKPAPTTPKTIPASFPLQDSTDTTESIEDSRKDIEVSPKNSVYSIDAQLQTRQNGQIIHNNESSLSETQEPEFVQDGCLNRNNLNFVKNNDPFLAKGNTQTRRNLLEPIELATRDAGPSWSLAKGTKRKKSFKNHVPSGSNEIIGVAKESNADSLSSSDVVIDQTKKVPTIKNGLYTTSGEISTIHEGREHFVLHEESVGETTLDLFQAGLKK